MKSLQALQALRARDLMQAEVLTVAVDAAIREAVELIEDYHVSSVPVVNEAGEVVGMLSSADIARSEHVEAGRLRDESGAWDLANPVGDAAEEELTEDEEFSSKEDYSPGMLGRQTVGDWMTPRVLSVPPDATLREICELMAREGVHRVLVLDRQRLAGIISTMDVVRRLAEAL